MNSLTRFAKGAAYVQSSQRWLTAPRGPSEGPTVFIPVVSNHYNFLLWLLPAFFLPPRLLSFSYFFIQFPWCWGVGSRVTRE